MPQPAPDSDRRVREIREKWKRDFFAHRPPQPQDPTTGRLLPYPELSGNLFCDLPIEEVDDIDLQDPKYSDPLLLAPFDEVCAHGPVTALEEVLDNHHKTHAMLHRGLVKAIEASNVDTARVLLDHGAPLVRETPSLVRKVEDAEKKVQFLELFHSHGWDPNTGGFYGSVLVESFSAAPKDLPVLRWLLDHGANPNLGRQRYNNDRYGAPNDDSGLALDRAAEAGHLEAVQLLLAKGAKLRNANALHRAAGACPPDQDPYDPSKPVSMSTEFDQSRIPVMQCLVDGGEDVNQPEHTRYITQTYPIVYAAGVNAVERVRWLLDHGADPTLKARDDEFGTALETAEKSGSEPLKELLRDWKRKHEHDEKDKGYVAQAAGVIGGWLFGQK